MTVSLRVDKIKNVNEVAMDAANRPEMLFKHYSELVTEKRGGCLVWGTRPEAVKAAMVAQRAAKVLELEKEITAA